MDPVDNEVSGRERPTNGQPSWKPLAVEHGFYDPLMAGSIDGTDDRAHDRGISRAMCTEYRPNKQISGNPRATLFVARLNPSTSEEDFRGLFSKYGRIRTCRLVKDIVTGRSKGYGFVEYHEERDAVKAYERGHHVSLDGAQIIVEMELERVLPGWKPRRFGGGFGGRKESGQLRFGGRDRTFRKPIVLGSRGGHYGSMRRNHYDRDNRSSSRQHSHYHHHHKTDTK